MPAGSDGEEDRSDGSSEGGGWRKRKAQQRSEAKSCGAQRRLIEDGRGGASGAATRCRREGASAGSEGWRSRRDRAEDGDGEGTAAWPVAIDSGEGELSECDDESSEDEVLGMNTERREMEGGGKKKRSREVMGLEGSQGFVANTNAVDGGRSGSVRRRMVTAATPPTRKRERTGVTRVTSDKATRVTLASGIRIDTTVVARMDVGDDTWLGERRARMRQRQAESRTRGDG